MINPENIFEWLQKWYESQCNGYWECNHGIKIETVDNPGWYLVIDLQETAYMEHPFFPVDFELDEMNWYFCLLRNNNFEASCSIHNLAKIFMHFRKFILGYENEKQMDQDYHQIAFKNHPFNLLQNWYLKQCDGDWEHEFGIKINTLSCAGWSVSIDLTGTDSEYLEFTKFSRQINERDWIHCDVEKKFFKGTGTPQNLIEIISVFINWETIRK